MAGRPARNRRRSVSTIVGVALAATLIFVSWAMLDTVQILLDRQFIEVQRADAEVVLVQPMPASEAVATLSGTEEVETAEPQLTQPATIVAGCVGATRPPSSGWPRTPRCAPSTPPTAIR